VRSEFCGSDPCDGASPATASQNGNWEPKTRSLSTTSTTPSATSTSNGRSNVESNEDTLGVRQIADNFADWGRQPPHESWNRQYLVSNRIDVDPTRGARIADLFSWYASGQYSLNAVVEKARAVGLTHPRSGRSLYKAEVHRILQNPIYYGEFVWLGHRYQGSHQPLISRELFAQAQAILKRKPRACYPKQRHAFMGLLTCARCGCAITAERKKEKYTYYRCTGFHGACGNGYIREEQLATLLGTVVAPIQITAAEIADDIAAALRASDADADHRQRERATAPRPASARDPRAARSRLRRFRQREDLRGVLDTEVATVGGGTAHGGRRTRAIRAAPDRDPTNGH
jgi:Recombinase/Recombinase zinc beta ribbon domain